MHVLKDTHVNIFIKLNLHTQLHT